MATIRFSEGTTYRQQYTLLDETSTPIDLTGAALMFAAYPPGAPKTGVVSRFLSKSTDAGGVDITDAVHGVVLVTFNPSETVDRQGVYDWELQLTEINGDVWLAGNGALIISPGRRLDD